MNYSNIVCSVSGGRSSAFMVHLLETLPVYKNIKKYYVFANTGKEMGATYLFLYDIERWFGIKIHLIEADVNEEKGLGTHYKVIPNYTALDTDGKVFESVVSKYGLPSFLLPHCTRELKVVPIAKFIKYELGLTKADTVQAIGFRSDEQKRINNKPHFIYPLNDNKITKDMVVSFFETEPYKTFTAYPLEDFEGNCDFCIKKSKKKLLQMASKHPNRLLWWMDLENKYYDGDYMYRGRKSAYDFFNDRTLPDNDLDIGCACGHDEDFFTILN